MTGFLTKPVQPADLAEMITTATQRPGHAGHLPRGGQSAPSQAAQHAAATRTVLYIDDEPALRGLVERILTKDPAVVVLTAANASMGAQLAVDRQPDLILLDLHLAGASGESLISDLRADDRTSTIPIVVVSGDVSPQTVKRLADLDVAGQLAKPFDAERLRATITAAVRRLGQAPTTGARSRLAGRRRSR